MAGIDLGGLAGGLAQGLEEGVDLREKYEKLAKERRAQQGRQLWEQAVKSAAELTMKQQAGQDAKAPGMDAAKPQAPPQLTPPPGPVGAPGGAPGAPPPGGAPAPPPMGGPPPGGPPPGAPPPGQPAQVPMPGAKPMQPPTPMPAPTAQQRPPGGPPAGGGAPPAAGGPPPGGPPKPPSQANDPKEAAMRLMADPNAQAKLAIQSYATQLLKEFPNRKWKPGELLDAIDAGIDEMKLADPIVAQMAKLQLQYNLNMMRGAHWTNQDEQGQERADTGVQREKDTHQDRQDAIKAGLKRAQMSQDTGLRRQAMSDATRLQAEDMIQSGANERQGKMIDFRQQALDAGLDEKEWQTQISAALKEQGMSDAFITKLFGSESANAPGGQPPAPPSRGVPKPLPSPPRRGATSAGDRGQPAAKGGSQYRSAEDVRQAYHDGKLTKEQARAALKPFGYE